jgi:phosphate transport system permease protein
VLDLLAPCLTGAAACFFTLLLLGIFYALFQESRPTIDQFGWRFLVTREWNPVTNEFGALSSIFGTVVSTLIAMLLAVPVSLLIALFLVELAPPWLSATVGTAIELLAAVPSIIYGMWGLFVLAPLLADEVQPALQKYTGDLPLFSGPPMGLGFLTAGLVLAVMVLPFTTAITRDVFRSVPPVVREAAYGLGATTWEVTRTVTLPYGLRGVIGAVLLGLGRAMGETMAVTFVIGNSNNLPKSLSEFSLFEPGNTISSRMANEFMEASSSPLYISALIELGFILLVLTVVVQILAQLWIRWFATEQGVVG